ncbi:uncharacterized protein LOC121253501 [Juglans microcarpa x Juglans regia]|uniref:uncharacterized protein LOC121253501 n=1 Tax=Juglans microcarpa x Juglans regia TaxID=2249226 RepID=UPI001B7DB0FE|nr:uncharacterized protein LOC121253501 [Juglans microcarpa x Juglans regia]
MHAIWFYPAAADVWSESNTVIQKWRSNKTDLLELWDILVEKVSKDVLEEIAMVMRNIWLRRNEFIFERVFKSPSQVIKAARDELRVFQLVQQNARQTPAPRVEREAVLWSKPRESFVKANWDAAVSIKDRKVGLGVVIRDEGEEILVVAREQKKILTDSATAECLALWKAMEVCRELNFNRVLFKGDVQVIVNAVNKGEEDFSSYGSVVEDAKKLLKAIENWSVNFVYREANEAAHVLAHEALFLHPDIVWIEEIPNCIRSIICKGKSSNEVIVQ